MKKIIMIAAAIATLGAQAFAAEPKKQDHAPNGGPSLTVLEALNLGAALRQLGDHPGADGKTVSVSFKFDGGVLFAMATDIAAADVVTRNYQQAYNALAAKMGVNVPLDKDAPVDVVAARTKLKSEFDAETEKMIGTSAGQLWVKIKRADLCVDSKPVAPCTVTNAIPPALLAALIPILEP